MNLRYGLEIFSASGESAGQRALEADFEPAIECARLLAVRRRALPAAATRAAASVEPKWHADRKRPYTSGFRIRLTLGDDGEFACDFEASYFRDQVQRVSSELVESGALKSGERFRFAVTAFPGSRERDHSRRPRCVDVSPPLPLQVGRLADHLIDAEARGDGEPGDLPVFIPRRVLDEAAEQARAAGEIETGGLLVGHLVEDPQAPEVLAVVTAQIPASETKGTRSSLEFTPATWSKAREMLALRKRGEIFLGWHHSHPSHAGWQCAKCPIERRRVCPLATNFFSDDDRGVHRTIFPRAWGIALVANVIATDEVTFSLFGWRDGAIVSRGFHVPSAAGAAAQIVEEDRHHA